MDKTRKYLQRLGVSVLIYFFFHFTLAEDLAMAVSFNYADRVFFVYIVAVVMLIWELIDFTFRLRSFQRLDISQSGDLVKAVIILSLVIFPPVVLASWVSEYWLKPALKDCVFVGDNFVKDVLEGQVLGMLIVSQKLIRKYYEQVRKMEGDKAKMQKELLLSQYVNLKNQIKPHFLFNSFSVLQSLIETEPEKASKFLSRLSKMYRHLLESREDSMSSLDKELEMLDSYLYLLNVRHEDSLDVNINIDSKYLTYFVPTLSLQMLIENVVKHNRFSKQNPLVIRLFTKGEYFIVENSLNKKGTEIISTKIGLENLKSQYEIQSDIPVLILEDDQYFTVKLPILASLRFA